jgi:hypothetical protein
VTELSRLRREAEDVNPQTFITKRFRLASVIALRDFLELDAP